MSLLLSLFVAVTSAWGIEIPDNLPESHPRVLTTENGRSETLDLIEREAWAKDIYQRLKSRTDKYIDRGEDWLVSRLQMYWKSHATDVYIKGEFYSHAGGDTASVPTVMYPGARSHGTNYRRPPLEDVKPYAEEKQGMWLRNKSLAGEPYEWAAIANTGTIVQSINVEILGYARDAAFLWWLTGEEKYARMSAKIFDTYMAGIYHRHVPVDLNNGHQQTLVGMTSFEVIHEDAINALVPLYDFLYPYLVETRAEQMPVYAGAFKKWADNIIDNGVPHNNWNLIQARFIMDIALVLENNETYADGKGREYYLNKVLNDLSIRQWSLKSLADYGFDPATAIWCECPGYSVNVVADYTSFVSLFDRTLHFDLAAQMPVIPRAVAASMQYLFPNGMIVGFGDTHPNKIRTDMVKNMIRNARLHGKREQEVFFTSLLKCLDPQAATPATSARPALAVTSFFGEKPLELDPSIPAGVYTDYVTPTFYSPNVSWLVQRTGMDRENSLMISLNASEGNHQHANGISMELYGCGYPLAPDAGIGKTLYSGLDYLEYYGQFPSHNTVCVDGVSSYPIMKSNHAFDLLGLYPASGDNAWDFHGVTYSRVAFREPESRADQERVMGIVTSESGRGYYVDIFRSRKERGGDKMHDYFYHNLGQQMSLTFADGTPIDLQPSDELAFAGAHLYAYSYIYDQQSACTDRDIRASFVMNMPDGDDIRMTMWQKGEPDRRIFKALSPATEGLSRIKDFPYKTMDYPTLTFVARQDGEAWTRPFVSVFEPSTVSEPSSISVVSYFEARSSRPDFVGIRVEGKSGRTDYIFSQTSAVDEARHENMSVTGMYAVISSGEGYARYFLADGMALRVGEVSMSCAVQGNMVLERKADGWYYTSSQPCKIKIGKKRHTLPAGKNRKLD